MDTQRDTERRQKPRNAVDRVAFIQMADGNSGTILDVSETGLRFRTVAPVAENGPVEFWYSMNLSDRVEASGEVVWRDATKKEGGLCFTHSSAKAEAKSGKKTRESRRTKVPKNSGGFAVLGAIPEMRAEAETEPIAAAERRLETTRELTPLETNTAADSGVNGEDAARANAENGAERAAAEPGQRRKPQWKVELEDALARRRAAGNLSAAPAREIAPEQEPEREPEQEEEITAEKEPSETKAKVSPPPYVIPPIPAELFAKITARENERFYMPHLEPAGGSGWPFVKGIFAGMVATAAIVALGFYYMGLRQERAAEHEPQQIDQAAATEPAENAPAGKDAVENPPGVLPQNSAPATSGSAASLPAPSSQEPDGKASDPRTLASKEIPQAGAYGAATPNSAAGGKGAATGALPGQTTQRAAPPPIAPEKITPSGVGPAAAVKPRTLLKGPHTPTELWMEVAAGNTSAQIILAQMYAVGDGVGKNCEQARVLLKAAAAKGNAEAIRKYDDINATSCK